MNNQKNQLNAPQKLDEGNRQLRSDSTSPFQPNWLNLGFLAPIYVVGVLGWPIYLWMGGDIVWGDIALFFFMYAISAMGITVIYHRGMSHRGYKMKSPLKFLGMMAGSAAGEGSILAWCADHRRHHLYEDTPRDPYNVNRGFWWAHIGWIFGAPSTTDFSNCKDLSQDQMIYNQHRYYILYYIFSAFILPMGIGALFGRPLEGLLLGGFTRLFVVNQVTFMVNSWAHYFGRQPYCQKITAKDSLLVAVLAFGEGWHNYHHRFPFDYRNGHRFYHWDPSKWAISAFHRLGLAHDLKTTPEFEILKAKAEILKQKAAVQTPPSSLTILEEKLMESYQKWKLSFMEWQKLRQEVSNRRSERLKELKAQVQVARREFKFYYAQWKPSLRLAQA